MVNVNDSHSIHSRSHFHTSIQSLPRPPPLQAITALDTPSYSCTYSADSQPHTCPNAQPYGYGLPPLPASQTPAVPMEVEALFYRLTDNDTGIHAQLNHPREALSDNTRSPSATVQREDHRALATRSQAFNIPSYGNPPSTGPPTKLLSSSFLDARSNRRC